MAKYINADLLIRKIQSQIRLENLNFAALGGGGQTFCINTLEWVLKQINSLQEEQTDMGEVSDGYHTFNELYYYRMLYNAAFFNLLPKEWVHKSKKHHTGEECFGGGWFIVMANLPTGQISNHYELKDWDLFQVPEKEFADEWDGHTPQEAAERLHSYLQQEQPEKHVLADLEEAAWKYAPDLPSYNIGGGYLPPQSREDLRIAFKDGANLQKEQDDRLVDIIYQQGIEKGKDDMKEKMLREAVEGEVHKLGEVAYVKERNNAELTKYLSRFNNGDKVKIIVIHETDI